MFNLFKRNRKPREKYNKNNKTEEKSKGTLDWIEQIKSCGQSIIDNAEQLADIGKYQTSININISILPGESPRMTANTEWLPESYLDARNIASINY